jgi:hypothetical protein
MFQSVLALAKRHKYHGPNDLAPKSQPMESQPSSLRQLSNIIAQAVTDIEAEYAKASTPLPALDESFNPTNPAEAVGTQPAVFTASSMIIAAAAQITATVSNPALAIINNSLGVSKQVSARRITKSYDLSIIFRRAFGRPLH